MDINLKSINNLKALAAETVSNAKSGHTGSAISASPILYSLFSDHLCFNPKDTNFLNRDRFVMSAGHASAILYSILHLFGYNISIDDLKQFRVCGSKTPGHPEYKIVPGVETTTGPLGQGVANAVGMAIGQTILEANFNTKDFPLFNNYTYCYAGDGCLMEGVTVEACSLAGTLALNKLILLYEDNNITIDGSRTLANNDDTAKKFEAMGWNVITVKNGNEYQNCTRAIGEAKKSKKPTIVIFKTTIGIGTKYQGTSKIHACPLSAEDLAEFKTSLGVSQSFCIESDVYAKAESVVKRNIEAYNNWSKKLAEYKQKHPEKYKELTKFFSNKKVNYQKILNTLLKQPEMSGRDVSGVVLNEICQTHTEVVGGAADLVASTKATIQNGGDYCQNNRAGKNIHYGIREHSMGSISNGIALYLGTPVFDSTFTMFANYMLPALRMRAMMKLPVISILTHDSINIGQDGPTHQPIESLPTLRAIPDYTVFRPATKAEVVAGYKVFFESQKPTALVLTKNKISNFENSTIENAERGAYVALDTAPDPKIEIFASGTEVALAIDVAKQLNIPIRVISVPCESIFAVQDKSYKKTVLLSKPALRVAIEASNDTLWYKYIGDNGLIFNVTTYQSSGDGNEVYKKAGFDATKIAKKIEQEMKGTL